MLGGQQVLFQIVFLGTAVLSITPTKKCPGKSLEPVKLEIGDCTTHPCIIKRNTTVPVDIHFKLDRDARELFSNVYANILSIPFPFIGVDGSSVCNSIYDTDGKTKVSCPLKKDHVYRYINTFKILDRYPKIDLEVHWSLNEKKNGRELICFDLPSKITNYNS
ncbi:hypothetical protein WDU94_013074 [Cyamophila willieti]